MIRGSLITTAKLGSQCTGSGFDTHMNNIRRTLGEFSELEMCYPKINVPIIGYLMFLSGAMRAVNHQRDYFWVRVPPFPVLSLPVSSPLLWRARKKGICIYDRTGSAVEQLKIQNASNFKIRLAQIDEFYSLSLANLVRVHTSQSRSYLIREYEHKIPSISQKIHVIPIPVPVREYPVKKEFGHKITSLVFVGTPSKWQGLEFLIRSLAKLDVSQVRLTLFTQAIPPDIKCMIEEEKIGERVEQNFLPHDELISVLPHYDIFVIPRPSYKVTELSAPIKLIEAMSCGLPIVATDVGGVNKYIEHKKTGYLVKPGDAEALARGIMEVIKNPELARKIGGNARQFAEENFEYNIIGQRIKDMICSAQEESG